MPEDARWRMRAAVGLGQLAYGVRALRRRGHGWYHVVLGMRQLGQSRLDASGAFSPSADAAVDGIHVATMLLAALVRRGNRRAALAGAAHALVWTLLDAALRRRGASTRRAAGTWPDGRPAPGRPTPGSTRPR